MRPSYIPSNLTLTQSLWWDHMVAVLSSEMSHLCWNKAPSTHSMKLCKVFTLSLHFSFRSAMQALPRPWNSTNPFVSGARGIVCPTLSRTFLAVLGCLLPPLGHASKWFLPGLNVPSPPSKPSALPPSTQYSAFILFIPMNLCPLCGLSY